MHLRTGQIWQNVTREYNIFGKNYKNPLAIGGPSWYNIMEYLYPIRKLCPKGENKSRTDHSIPICPEVMYFGSA
jgi:hypothetical protein